MNRRLKSFALATVLAYAVVAPAHAQWREQVDRQMTAFQSRIAERGFRMVGEPRNSSLKSGEKESLTFNLQGGASYVFVGFCDNDCSDLDLTLYDPAGTQVDIDIEVDDAPVVEVSPPTGASYRVEVAMASCSVSPCFYTVGLFSNAAGGASGAAGTGPRIEQGRLAAGDDTLSSGEYADVYTFDGRRGEQVVVDLRSQDFDPYLILRTPSGERQENDDHEGDATRSLISLSLTEDGSHMIIVTSYRPKETGNYSLRIDRQQAAAVAAAAGPRIERGRLAVGDDTLRTGEFLDAYEFYGQPGQHLRVDLSSNDFDTYLIVKDPAGHQQENDDADRAGHSVVEMDLTEVGTYRVMVTSYSTGETGSYELTIDGGQAAPAAEGQRDVIALRVGQPVSGQLSPGDTQLENGEYRDVYVFDGQAGQSVSVELTSSAFDTYLALVTPNGEDIQNDDFDGSTSRSRIDMTLRESGRYRVIATSYKAEETGAYELTVRSGDAPVVAQGGANPLARPAPSGAGQVYGIFAGISDYPGTENDLAYTADDAVRVRNAMMQGVGMQPGNGILLTDGNASRANLRSSIQSLSGRMGPNDTFVFFYSGHGSRIPRSSFQPSDPDALDETLELYDGSITDDEMGAILDAVPAGRIILLFDACFSGGFSKDVISAPGRMGMFSSEEDVTSAVAAKFRAGGYLSLFVADGIGEHLADADEDGQLTALELSQYVHERYRADVKSGPNDFVRTGGPQSGYQHLVVDRGSIGPYDVILRW